MSRMSVATRVMEEKNFSLQLVRSNRDDGSVFHLYLVVQASRVEDFHTAIKDGETDFHAWGYIVTWGEGLNPPKGLTEKVLEHVKKKESELQEDGA